MAYLPAAQAEAVSQPETPEQAAASAPVMPELLVMRYCRSQVEAV
jgi:hypothetical protein